MKRTGYLIAFEGIDGTGKSTHLRLLAGHLAGQGYAVVKTREPTDGEHGKRIRSLFSRRAAISPAEELQLFLDDRRQHVREVIEPALLAGKVVLTDRYYFSTAAYQGAAGFPPEEIFASNAFAPKPDLVLLLTQDPQVSLRRIRESRGDRLNDFEQLEQLTRVAALFATFSQPCIRRIDAGRPLATVQDEIRQVVGSNLPPPGP